MCLAALRRGAAQEGHTKPGKSLLASPEFALTAVGNPAIVELRISAG
jgi:hypothetical protein